MAQRKKTSRKKVTKIPEGSPYAREMNLERELIVIAKPDAELRATRSEVKSAAGADVSFFAAMVEPEEISMAPLFGASEERLKREAEKLTPTERAELPDISVFYRVQAPDEQLDDLAEKLMEQDTVEAAYVKPPAEPAVASASEEEFAELVNEMHPMAEEAPSATPDFSDRQIYLNAAPEGIDARYAWTVPGGRGAGVQIIDIEGAWRFTHEDLTQNQGGVVGAQSSSLGWRNHGTAVVGEFGGDQNDVGTLGISPDAQVRGFSIFDGDGSAGTLRRAADALSAGDIILIELHRPGPRATGIGQFGYIAIEWWPDDYAAIRYATNKGIIVVEAAGNGFQNLDDPIYDTRPVGFPATWVNPFNPANPSSMAVIVGAGAPPQGTHGRDHGPDRSRLNFSNYGRRVDSQGWGREVTTTGYGDLQGGSNEDLWYTDMFSGTSSASPIVVGALACTQGVLRAQGGTLLTPATATQVLRTTGSPQQDHPDRPSTQRIGTRPDLRQLLPGVAKLWHHNLTLKYIYVHHTSEAAWVFIDSLGWRRIKTGSVDGVTNMLNACSVAVANSRNVHVYVDGTYLYRLYLL
jgi:hypothetical protein